jgi:DNA-binding FrmR family transcriptional regulator
MPREAEPNRINADTTEKHGPHPVNTRALRRLGIIEGQLKGIRRMIEEEYYCIDILTQISAARAALNGVGKLILRRHIEQCFSKAIHNDGRQSTEMIDELMEVFSREEL